MAISIGIGLKGRHFLTLEDFTREEILTLVERGREHKRAKREGREERRLVGKNLVLIFEKTSTRTRCAFEVAAYDQGAQVTYLAPGGSQIGHKESIRDTARVLGSMYDGIEYRGFGQEVVEELARYAGVPVWNGLTDQFHPTQVLADLITMAEHSTRPLERVAFCYVGDARNNMANSLLIGGSKLGMDVRLAAPRALWPEDSLVERCRSYAAPSGGRVLLTESVDEGVDGCDFLHTDVWLSMGEAEEKWAERIELLRAYRVTAQVLAATGKRTTRFMHCLPAFHDRRTEIGETIYERFGLDGIEVTDDVFESEASIVFTQAGNRVHAIKAVLVATLHG